MTEEEKKEVGFFTDSEGNKSSMRIISFIGSFLILGVWTIVSLKNMEMTPMGYEHASLLLVLIGGKAGQAFLERRNNNN